MRKLWKQKKRKRVNKEEIKKQLATIKNAVEIEELIEVAEEVKKPEETADIIKQ